MRISLILVCLSIFGTVSGELHMSLIIFFLLHCTGRYLSMLPVDPKLGKMLIMGAVFRCHDPILTIVSGLSVRDPFLLPQDKKDVSLLFAHPLVLLLFILALWTTVHLAPVCYYALTLPMKQKKSNLLMIEKNFKLVKKRTSS
jgi:HrpA-like RNA helicase